MSLARKTLLLSAFAALASACLDDGTMPFDEQDLGESSEALVTTGVETVTQARFGSELAVASWGPGRLDVFYRANDSTLRHRWRNQGDAAWSAEENLGGNLLSDPAAFSCGTGRIDVFVRGADSTLMTRTYTSSGWGAWRSLGGVVTSTPAVTGVFSTGTILLRANLDVFYRGVDGTLRQRSLGPKPLSIVSVWKPEVNHNQRIVGRPSTVARKAGDLVVYAASEPTAIGGMLIYRVATNGVWGPWTTSSFSGFTKAPIAVRRLEGVAEVLIENKDSHDEGRFSAWRHEGPTIIQQSGPMSRMFGKSLVAVPIGPDRLELFARTTETSPQTFVHWVESDSCGGDGQDCCFLDERGCGNVFNTLCHDTNCLEHNLKCDDGVCADCGEVGDLCCSDGSCAAGLVCHASMGYCY